ncbi:MAG: PDZ domain-containing protein [Acholeplasmatales bacterium]|nr:PDZ domain-containing protein [Acholeplasmatales bacterium]
MELSRGKRLALGLAMLFIVVGCFMAGYLFANVKPSKRMYANELTEITTYLDEYYYKDYDKDEFLKQYLKGGVNSLNDPYTYLYFKESENNGSYVGYGFGVSEATLGLKVGRVYKQSPANEAGLKRGDYIIGVDDVSIDNKSLDDISDALSNAKDEVTLHILRNFNKFDVKIKKGSVTPDKLVESKIIGTVGYIKISEFDSGAASSFKEELKALEEKNITGLIIDVRDNPGGLVNEVVSILRLFLDGNDAFVYLDSKKEDDTDIYRPTAQSIEKAYDIKVLMNENSASASEVFALAMNRVKGYDLIGEKSFGKGVFQNDIKLESIENGYLHVTCGYWYGPNRESIDKKGIDPTVEVIENIYSPLILTEDVQSLDMANDDIKNYEIMLECLGSTTRTDGYFDSNLETILQNNYSSTTLDLETKTKILEDYNNYINDYNNDIVLNKALDLLK